MTLISGAMDAGLTNASVTAAIFVATCRFAPWVVSEAWSFVRMWWKAKAFSGPPVVRLLLKAFSPKTDLEVGFNIIIGALEKYGTAARIWLGPKLVILIASPEDSRRVLNNSNVTNRDHHLCCLVDGFMDRSLVSVKGDLARVRRNLFTPAFHAKFLAKYFDVFTRKGEELCARLDKIADGRTLDIRYEFSASLLDAFFETFFGVGMEWSWEQWEEMSRDIVEGNDLVFLRGFSAWTYPSTWVYSLTPRGRRNRQIRENFKTQFKKGLDKYLQMRNSSDGKTDHNSNQRNPCILDIINEKMRANGVHMTEDELCEDVLFMAMAVVETTAKALAYTLILLGMNPEYQEQALEEQRAIFQDSLRPVTEDDLKMMPKLELIIKESMRIFPPIGGLNRNVPVDIPLSDGRVVPAGCMALVSNFFVHRDASNFVDPERFWPERWNVENSVGRHPFAYFPFGGGVRKCIGQKYSLLQMRVALGRVLRQFRFTNGYTMKDLRRLRLNLSNVSVLGYDVQVHKREGKSE